MKKIIKQLLIYCLFINSYSIFGQVEDYIEKENNRINQALIIEEEVESYISANIANFTLPQSLIDSVTSELMQGHDGSGEAIEANEIQLVLLNIKEEKLREQFFIENPEKKEFFIATELPEELKQTCINGGFEDGEDGSVGYNFSQMTYLPSNHLPANGCNSINPYLSEGYIDFPASENNFLARASIVTTQNEPLLWALGQVISTTFTGDRALKLNPSTTNINTDGQTGNITVMHRDFIINENNIDFNFLQIGHRSGTGHTPPFFRYRLINLDNDQVLVSKCFPLINNDCRYTEINDTRAGNAGQKIIFSGWICERIQTEDFWGMNVRLEYTVSDCQLRGHFNTVYLDNICGTTCNPTWGSINLNPVNVNCPTSQLNVCGTFQIPINHTIEETTLNVIDSTGQIMFTLDNPNIIDNTFCFTVNPNLFGSNPVGNYEFEVNSSFIRTCGSNTFTNPVTDLSANDGADISFNGCCISNVVLSSPTNDVVGPISDNRQASSSISASNKIASSAVGIYHAGTSVVLTNGFHSAQGSRFRGYIEGCTGMYFGKTSKEIKNLKYQDIQSINKQNIVNEDDISIYPNPSSSSITVSYNQIINNISILSIDGKLVLNKEFNNESSYEIDISLLENGIYLVSAQTSKGKVITKKLIKK